MAWLCDLGSIPQGIITGVVPPVLLALVNLLLPVILRREFEGASEGLRTAAAN
jgi:hypothetical protein